MPFFFFSGLLYKAPELLRDPYIINRGTCKSDVYAFALVLYEILGRCGPWGHTNLSNKGTYPGIIIIEYNIDLQV